jgi:hypothetical protein
VSTLKTRIGVRFHVETTGVADLSAPVDVLDLVYDVLLRAGSGAGQASKGWNDGDRSIAASGTDDIDLSGALINKFGEAVVFTAVKAIIIRAEVANVNNVVIGAGANPWIGLLNATGTITLKPGAGVLIWADQASAAGYPVVAGTGDILRVANGGAGTAVLYDIAVVGI